MKVYYIIYIRDCNQEIVSFLVNCSLFYSIKIFRDPLYSTGDIKVYNFHHFTLDTCEEYNLFFIQAHYDFFYFFTQDLKKGSLKVKIEQINRDNR